MRLRVCLFHVKYFSKNIYFLRMLLFIKENIFKYLVAFLKLNPKKILLIGSREKSFVFLVIQNIFMNKNLIQENGKIGSCKEGSINFNCGFQLAQLVKSLMVE